MKKSLLILPLVLLASALALTACGGGGSSSSGGGGEEGAIEEAIETSATTTDPSKCTELQTEEFNEQEKGVTGKEATEQCEESAEAEEAVAESVEISNINVEGETATADVAITGSALNGQTVELELVQEEGAWKLNHFLSFSEFDGQALADALEEELEKSEAVGPTELKCLVEGFSEFSQQEAEAVAFESDTEVLEEKLGNCK